METKSREKQFAKNTGIIAVGTLLTKIVSFFLLPLYTNYLSTEDYGNVDVLETIVSFIIPIITLELSAAVFRFLIDHGDIEGRKEIISTGFCVALGNLFFSCLIILTINFFFPFQYAYYFLCYVISLTLFTFIQDIVRGLGDNFTYSVMSFLVSTISVVSNIVLIVSFGFKGEAILISLAVSSFIGFFIGFFAKKMWKYISVRNISPKRFKQLFKYSWPLIPNALSWWIVNASDRLIILFFLGASFNGIYAAANKIPSIYTTIFNVYNLAWIEAVSRNAFDKDSNQSEFINGVLVKSYKLFGCIITGIICCSSIFFNKLIGPDYSEAYVHIYILCLAIFVNSICSLYGGVFTAYKRTDIIGKTTVLGAVINIAINLSLVKFIGLYAASISTLASYLVICVIRLIYCKKMIKLTWPWFYFAQFIVAISLSSIGFFYNNLYVNLVILILLLTWSIIVNRKIIFEVSSTILGKIHQIILKIHNKFFLKISLPFFTKYFGRKKINPNFVIVDSFGGKGFGDNPKYIVLELLKHKELSVFWCVNSKSAKLSLPQGVKPLKMYTIKYLSVYSRSHYIIDNVRVNHLIPKKEGQIYLQTWHAPFGFKFSEKSSEVNLPEEYVRLAKYDGEVTDGIISNSKLLDIVYQRDFWLNSKTEILQFGLPRNDSLFSGKLKNEEIRKKMGFGPTDMIVMYAPTFRDDLSTRFYNIDIDGIIQAFNKRFSREVKLIIRLHPNVQNQSSLFCYNDHVINGSFFPDIQEIEFISDAIITDYSSIALEGGYLGKYIFLYIPDLELYEKNRGLEEVFYHTPFPKAPDNNSLIDSISHLDDVEYRSKIENFFKNYEFYDDGNASKKTVEWLLNYGK